MAGDLDRAKQLYDEDRPTFIKFLTSRATYLAFPHVMMVQRDGAVLAKVELAPLDGEMLPGADDLEAANDGEPWCLFPKQGNVFRLLLKLKSYPDAFLFAGRPVDPRAIEFLDSLPRTETGKLQRFALRRRAAGE